MAPLKSEIDTPTKFATFAMACFWAPDCVFGAKRGVIRTQVGYSGGTLSDPIYRALGDHAECIRIEYDPHFITFIQLLDIFWKNHDPTSKMKRQYTSIIFYYDEEEKKIAQNSLNEQQKLYEQPFVTEILPAGIFYEAEDYHQKYRLQQHPWLCKAVNLNTGTDFKKSPLAAKLNGYVWGQGNIDDFNEDTKKFGMDERVVNYVRKLFTEHKDQGLTC